jgi:hypothetical protein
MNKVEVYIAGLKLDLKDEDTVALTKQINDIAEIQKRQADYTNRFVCYKTPNNMAIAEMLNVPGNASTRPYKWASARIVSNGIPVTNYGIALLQETKNRQTYEYIIYAGNYDLFSKIDGKYITDLDWDDLIHTFDITQMYPQNDRTENFIYPIAETMDGRMNTRNNNPDQVDVEYQVPHVFVKTIWQRIFEEAGLEYHGNFFATDAYFNNELVPADVDNVDHELNSVKFKTKGDKINPGVYPYSVIAFEDPNSLKDPLLDRNYVVKERGRYVLSIDYNYQVQASLGIVLFIAINGVTQLPGTVFSTVGCPQETLHIEFTKEYDLVPGDRIAYVAVASPRSGCSPLSLQAYEVDHEMSLQFEGIPSLLNYPIDFSLYLPKVLQVDFLKAIMQQYGLLYQLNNDGRYEFIRIEDLLNGLSGSSDLSDKYHAETSETYRIGSYGLINYFKYKYYDKDLRGKGYADATFSTHIDNVDREQTVMDSIIEACGDYLFLTGPGKLASIHSYEKIDSEYFLRANDKLKTVLLNRVTKPNVGLYVNAGLYTSWNLNIQYPFVKFTPLHWDNLLTLYYPKFILMIQRPIKKKVLLWFTPIDIYFLDMFKIIYLEQYQSYFYLNKVNNFLPGKLSDCELIKIN